MKGGYEPTLTMEEYAAIYRRAYYEHSKTNDGSKDYWYRRLVKEAIAAKRGMTAAEMEKKAMRKEKARKDYVKRCNQMYGLAGKGVSKMACCGGKKGCKKGKGGCKK